MALPATLATSYRFVAVWAGRALLTPLALFLLRHEEDRPDVYNILWVLVFAFATLNILGLVAKRFDSDRNRMSFGEMIAVMVVVMAVVLLGWELLTLFHVFPLKLHSR